MSHLSHQGVQHSSLRLLCLSMKTGSLASSESPDEVIKNLFSMKRGTFDDITMGAQTKEIKMTVT